MPTTKRPKIVQIIARLNTGGPARIVCHLHRALQDSYDTVLITGTLDEGEGDMSYLLCGEDSVYRVESMSRSISYWKDAAAFWKIVKMLRRERPDIVHTHTAKAGTLGRIAAVLARVPVRIHTYHGNVFQSYFSPAKSRVIIEIERALGLLTSMAIAISDSQADELTSTFSVLPPKKVCVVKNGFSFCACADSAQRQRVREEFGIDPAKTVVLWAGRMAPVKDPGLLAEVIKASSGDARFHFLVVGDGLERAALCDAVRGCPNVSFAGWRRDMEAICAAADIALLTSRNEGTPTSLIEAMAAAKPFVTTVVGGISDMLVRPLRQISPEITFAANGVAVSAKCDVIVAALHMLATDREIARKMGDIGREYALQCYSAERFTREMSDLYTRLLARETQAQTAVESSSAKPGGRVSAGKGISI